MHSYYFPLLQSSQSYTSYYLTIGTHIRAHTPINNVQYFDACSN